MISGKSWFNLQSKGMKNISRESEKKTTTKVTRIQNKYSSEQSHYEESEACICVKFIKL